MASILDKIQGKPETYVIGSGAHPHFTLFGHKIVMDLPIQALILSAVGAFVLIRFALQWLFLLAETFAFSGISLKKFGARKGKWAVVTGPTSGIGEAFANQLAKAGFNVVLVGRNAATLKTMEVEIAKKYKVETKIVQLDFAAKGEAQEKGFADLKAAVEGLPLGVLINNAGISHSMPNPFIEFSMEEIEEILQVNIHSTLKVTHALLPSLISTSPSLIITIGSMSGQVPTPYIAAYSGSKAYLTTWTQALGEELKEKGVVVQMVAPYFVVSKMSKIRRASALVPTANDYVRATLSSIGLQRGAVGRPYESSPYWSHAMLDFAIHCIPASWVLWYNLRMHKDIQRRVIRKREREAKKSQ